MASGVVRNDDESASLLDDDDDWSPVAAAAYPLPPSPLNGKAAAMRSPGHAVMRLIRSPFAAAFSRMTTSTRTAAVVSASDGQPMRNGDKTAVTERRREARRGPSLEQLLKIEAASPPPPPPSRPGRKSKPDTAAAPTYKVSTPTVKEKRAREREPLPPSSKGHLTAVGDDERRHAAAVPPAAAKSDAGAGGGQRTTNAKRLVVVLESLRTCSRDAAIDVVMPILPKRTNGKVAAAAGRAPGKAELFYCRPIPMGRRCRVQHLEETPYK